ncbi:hypothetical protein J437_LFUL003215 [Ladona fulva]|uniref:TSEN34 N-terminal domain-containing protein n=1 Tax=Ladona fulva TaxID=123851 RepID=A0A8K0JXK8_LADFU|nr:hypothetical protein J437_LFUL003215 [Ladona fulva]
MIDLTVDNGRVLVWNVDDVIKIRQEYRIVGQLLGTLASFSYQDKQRGLPLSLLNEEVNILVEKGFARLVQVPAISQKPSEEAVERFKEYREQSYQKQVAIFKEGREKQIRSMLDRIVEGKQNKRRQRMRSNISVMQSPGEAKKIKVEDEKVLYGNMHIFYLRNVTFINFVY